MRWATNLWSPGPVGDRPLCSITLYQSKNHPVNTRVRIQSNQNVHIYVHKHIYLCNNTFMHMYDTHFKSIMDIYITVRVNIIYRFFVPQVSTRPLKCPPVQNELSPSKRQKNGRKGKAVIPTYINTHTFSTTSVLNRGNLIVFIVLNIMNICLL